MRCAVLLLLAIPSVAHADYRPGEVPEATNAFVHKRHEVRLSLLGTSDFALTDRTEIGTYLLADALLFPNLRLEHQLGQSEHVATSFTLGAGAGVYPLAAGGVLPLPGAVVAGGGVGFAWGSVQSASVTTTVHAGNHALSLNAGGFAVEGGVAGIVGGVGAGGGGAGAGGGPAETHGSRTGLSAGVELAHTFGRRDALVAAVDAWHWQPMTMDGPSGLLYPRVVWTHQWVHWQLSGGAYALIDLPAAKSLRSKEPVAPFLNVAWAH